MRPPATLRRMLRSFLMLEIGAVALYRMHGRMVSEELKPLFRAFLSIEIGHRETFAELYRDLHDGRGWWAAPVINAFAGLLAFGIGLFGVNRILAFERNIERRAVADYTDALRVVEHAAVRSALSRTLADEFRHEQLIRMFERYRGDEERHVHELEQLLRERA